MALSLISRPEGKHIKNTAFTGIYTNGSTTITNVAHGLSSGDFIYVSTGQALGFWYVTKLTNDTFNLREYFGATAIFSFVGGSTFTYFKTVSTTPQWSAVHLPMVYKLSSNLWPTNSSDTARTVSSYANDNGYVKLTLSGTITATVTELEFVKVTFTGGTSAIYQILTWYSNSVVTINLAYTGGITFTSVQYYYNNYHAKIRIYAGLATGHLLAAQKPMALITEIKCVPDSAGIIMVNVNEFLKQQISVLKNNLNLNTLPNNIDAFCQYYISYAEGYDYSIGGYTLLDFISSYTDDGIGSNFMAVNADLPFKNLYSGGLNDYYYQLSDGNTQKFLTPTLYPVITSGQFFDISYLQHSGVTGTRMKLERYTNGSITSLEFQTISGSVYDYGVYRFEVTVSGSEDRIDLTWQTSAGVVLSEIKTIQVGGCAFNYIDISWLNYLGGFDYWRFKSNSDYSVIIENTTQVRKNIFTNWSKSYGAGGDTIRQETSRDSSQGLTVRAEYITMDQINDLYRIMTSPLVQIVNSRTDRRTVLPNADSFTYLQQSEKLFNLEIHFAYTDNLPSQSL